MYLDRLLSTHFVEPENLQKLTEVSMGSTKLLSILFFESVGPFVVDIPRKILEAVSSCFRDRPERIIYLGACFSSLAIAAALVTRVAFTVLCTLAAAVCFKLTLQNLQQYKQQYLTCAQVLRASSSKKPCEGCQKLSAALEIANSQLTENVKLLVEDGERLSGKITHEEEKHTELRKDVDLLLRYHREIMRNTEILIRRVSRLFPGFLANSANNAEQSGYPQWFSCNITSTRL